MNDMFKDERWVGRIGGRDEPGTGSGGGAAGKL